MGTEPNTPDGGPWDGTGNTGIVKIDADSDMDNDDTQKCVKRKPAMSIEEADVDRYKRTMRIEDDGSWIKSDGMTVDAVDVAEASSPARVVPVAKAAGLDVGEGTSMDLTTGWGFSKPKDRNLAVRMLLVEKPLVFIICVVCGPWGGMMNASWKKMDRHKVEKMIADARMHLDFACKLSLIQHSNGRYFVHEHPECARSWREPVVIRLPRATGAMKIATDQCMYGHVQIDNDGTTKAVKKPIICLINSPAMKDVLGKIEITNTSGWKAVEERRWHRYTLMVW